MKQDEKKQEIKVEEYNGTIEYTKDSIETVGLNKLENENGFDLRTNARIILKPYSTVYINTGLTFNIPEGYELKILSTVDVIKNEGIMPLGGQVSIVGHKGELIVPIQNITPRMAMLERGMPLGRILVEKINDYIKFKDVEKKTEEHDL